MVGELVFFPGVERAPTQPEKCLLVHRTVGSDRWSVSALWANIGDQRAFPDKATARAFADRISAQRGWPVREIGEAA